MTETGFNIARFSGNLNRYGTLQTNKFVVEIPSPRILGNSELHSIMQYRASNVRVPGASLEVQRVFRYGVGPEQKFPTGINFNDININFVDTQNKDIWKRFTYWFNTIFDYTGINGNSQASYKIAYKIDYATDIKIRVFDNDGSEINVIVLKEAFPTTLSEVGLSWSENNKLYEFSVGFSFKEWYFEGYQIGAPLPGAALTPSVTTAVQPRPVESPRPQEGGINPGGFTPEAQRLRTGNFGTRGRSQGFYGSEPPQEPPS